MKQKESDFLKFINRHFHVVIYSAYFFILMFLFYKAKLHLLFSLPSPGSDEFAILKAVKAFQDGSYNAADYKFSPAYILFLSILGYCSYGNLIIMRILQAALCSFIPVYIYKLSRKLRIGRENSQIAAFIYCLYGAAAMVSLSFSSNAVTALLFLMFIYFLIKSFLSQKWYNYGLTGFFAAFSLLFGGVTFLPVLCIVPLAALLSSKVRRRLNSKKITILILTFMAIMVPAVVFGRFPFRTFNFTGGLHSLFPLFSSYEIPESVSLYSYADILDFMKIFIVPFNFLVIMVLLSFTIKKRESVVFFIGLFIISYFIFILYPHNSYCNRAPVVPIMCVLAGTTIFGIRNEKSKLKIITLLLAASIFTFLTYKNPDSMRSDNEKRAVADILTRAGRYEKATAYLDKLENEGIASTDQWVELIKSICRSGDVQWSLEVEYLFLNHLKKRTDWQVIMPMNPNENKKN